MTTSTPANANSPASISPVGPPPAITTACSVIALRRSGRDRLQRTSHGQHVWVACGKTPPSRYVADGGEGSRSPMRHSSISAPRAPRLALQLFDVGLVLVG